MPGWTLIDTNPAQGRTFQRPLGATELGFFWEGLFNGTTDTLPHAELRLVNAIQDADLFLDANIVRAWLSTKRRYPLAGAVVEWQGQGPEVGTDSNAKEDGGEDSNAGFAWEPHFVVREGSLSTLRPGEIVFGQPVANAAEALQRAMAILNDSRPLSKELLTQLYVFRETNWEKTRPGGLHLMVLLWHCVTDAMATRGLIHCLLDALARRPGSEPAQMPLEDRLATAVPPEELDPAHLRALSSARRRWRRAIAAAILQLRAEKKQGGHTLPYRVTSSTPHTAARTCFIETSLTKAQTAAVIAKCRQHKLTFGNAFPPLEQVAMTRVLYRRYLRGEISEEEWTYRKRQPYIHDGPIDLRPFVDKGWFKKGGGGEFVTSIGEYSYQLPFMTLGQMDHQTGAQRRLWDGAPPFSDLMTFDRFLHRAGLVKKQAATFFKHPLLLEITHAWSRMWIDYQRSCALQWMEAVENCSRNGHSNEEYALSVTAIPFVVAHGGSSVGDLGPIFPARHPLPPTDPFSPFSPVQHPFKAGYVTLSPTSPLVTEADTTPKIAVVDSKVYLHTRPAELYLVAVTLRGVLNMCVSYDGNVFEDGVIKEWLDEVKGAVLWYIGGGSDGEGGEESGQGIQARL